MTVTISTNNTSVTVADASSILVTGTGDTVSTNSSTISFTPAGSLSVTGTGDTINLQTPGSTLNLAGTGATETVAVTSVTNTSTPSPYVINVSGDSVTLSDLGNSSASSFSGIIVNGSGDTLSLTNVGFANTTLTLTGNNDTLSVAGNSVPGATITIAGTGDAVTANNSTLSLTANSSAAITGSSDTINVTTGDTVTVTVTGTGTHDTIFGSGASVGVAAGSSVTFSGSNNSNTVSADGATIGLNGVSTLTVSGTGDTINLQTPGSTLNLAGTGATETVAVTSVTSTSSPSPYVINVSGDSVALSDLGNISASSFSGIIVNGSGDTLSLTNVGFANTTLALNGNNDTLSVAGSNIPGATITVAGTGDAVTANNSTVSLAANSSAAITGTNDTIFGSGASVSVAAGSSVTFSGANNSNTVSANGATIGLNGGVSTLTVSGTGDTINLQTPGSTLNLAGTGATETVAVTSVTNTSTPSPYVINVSGDSVALSDLGNISASSFSGIIVNGSGDTLSLTNVGFANTTLALNGNNDTLSVAGSNIPGATITVAGTGDAVTAGSSTVSLAANSSAAITGNSDTITVTTGDAVTVIGTNDTITVSGSGSTVTFTGNNGTVTGGPGGNILGAGGSNDTVRGGTGNDTLLIEGGTDTFFGGGGTDIFKVISAPLLAGLNQPQNLIADFIVASDKIDLSAVGIILFSQLSFSTVTFSGKSFLQIKLGNTGQAVMLAGVTANQLSASNFTFAPVGTPIFTAPDVAGTENQPIALNISLVQTEPDAGASSSLTIGGVPADAVLSNSQGVLAVTNGSISFSAAQIAAGALNGLAVAVTETDEPGFTLHATATTTDGNASISASHDIHVTVAPLAPVLTVQDTSGSADQPITLNIAAALSEVDPDSVLSIKVTGVPAGATLSAGTLNTADHSYTLTSAQLAGLTLTSNGATQHFNLTVAATTIEGGVSSTPTSASLHIDVTPVAVSPVLSVRNVSGLEDHAIALPIISRLADVNAADPGAVLSLTITGIPADASLSNSQGALAFTGGSITFTAAQLAGGALNGLAITPTSVDEPNFSLHVTATTNDAGSTASTSRDVQVSVAPDADPPILIVQNATGTEDQAIPLTISAALVESGAADPDATLSLTISGIPADATLSNSQGVLAFTNGSITFTSAQLAAGILDGIAITPTSADEPSFFLHVTATATDGTATVTTIANVPSAPGNPPVPIIVNPGFLGGGSVTISGIPSGAVLSNGGGFIGFSGGGSITFTAQQIAAGALNGLAIQETGPLDLTISGTSASQAVATEGTPAALGIVPSTGASVTISGLSPGDVLSNNGGQLTFTNGTITFTPDQIANGVLDGISVTPSPGTDTTTITVSTASTSRDILITVLPHADAPILSVQDASGNEDQPIALSISAVLAESGAADSDTSLSLKISGIPADAILTNRNHDLLSFTNGQINFSSAQLAAGVLDGLAIAATSSDDPGFTLHVTATEADGTASASISHDINVTVLPQADAPLLTVHDASGVAGQPVALGISTALAEADPDASLSLTIAGIPADAILSNGQGALTFSNGSITFSAAQLSAGALDGLAVAAPATDANFTLHITTTTTDGSGANVSTASTSGDINVNLSTGEPPQVPVLPFAGSSVSLGVNENSTAFIPNFIIAPQFADNPNAIDTITFSGIPADVTFSNANGALAVSNGSITLTPDQLAGLGVQIPDGDLSTITLQEQAHASAGGVTVDSAVESLTLFVNPVADAPILTVGDIAAAPGQPIALNIFTALAGPDADASLSLSIVGIPEDAVLSNSHGALTFSNNNISFTASDLAAGALDGLSITTNETDFELRVTATTTDGTGPNVSEVSTSTDVSTVVEPPNEAPVLPFGGSTVSVGVNEGSTVLIPSFLTTRNLPMTLMLSTRLRSAESRPM